MSETQNEPRNTVEPPQSDLDYKINLLDEVGSTGKNSLNKSTDDIVAVALQYNF